MATFKAIRIDKADKGTTAALTQFDDAELMDGDVQPGVADGVTRGGKPSRVAELGEDRHRG